MFKVICKGQTKFHLDTEFILEGTVKKIWKITDRIALILAALMSMIVVAIVWYFVTLFYLPTAVYLAEDSEKRVEFAVPVSVQTVGASGQQVHATPATRALTISSGKAGNVQMKLDLFGFIPAGNMDVNVIKTKKIIPGGVPVGIYMHTDGVLVLGTGAFLNEKGEEIAPSESIFEPGDYIVSVNNLPVAKKAEVIQSVRECANEALFFGIIREGEQMTVSVMPQKDREGEYKAGIWVSDSMQGIGTLSFVTADGEFAALGHGICDNAKGALLKLGYGALYQTDIVAIERGKKQDPGELTGVILLKKDRELGDILTNDEKGIYGSVDEKLMESLTDEEVEIGYKEDVKKGPVTILCTLDGTRKEYKAELTAIHNDKYFGNRSLEIRVTDQRLLNLTGGIVQGMSGTPILQDGKMIGVITHVFVDDPTKGYGIFVEEMLCD